MSGLLLVDNLFSVTQYPNHLVTAEEEASGFEADHVDDARRDGLSNWQPTTAASATWIQVQCDRVRAVNCWIFDRGSVLGTTTENRLQASNDGTTFTDEAVVRQPTQSVRGRLDDPNGNRTFEGAWGILLDTPVAAVYHRIGIDDMGAGNAPLITNLWVGLAYTIPTVERPHRHGGHEIIGRVAESDAGWRGRGATTRRRSGTVRWTADSFLDGDVARLHLEENVGYGRSFWLVTDLERSDRMILADATGGTSGELRTGDRPYEVFELSYVEWEAERP